MEKLIEKWYDTYTSRLLTQEEQRELIDDLNEAEIDFMDFAIEVKKRKHNKN